jgi:succinate-semialdehyde dehydrogenase/glutarate-semialdehyde dehydrogenase
MSITSINPFTGKPISTYAELSLKEAHEAVQRSHAVFQTWRQVSFDVRASLIREAGKRLLSQKQHLARLITQEMGKPLLQALAEIEKCAWVCDYFAENGKHFLKPERIKTDADKSYIAYEPLGVVLAIMPWNFPFWQAFRAAIPAIIAGNGMILKHASNVPGCALAIEDIFLKSGFSEGLFKTLLISSQTALSLIESPYVHGVTLTGSTSAGQSVAAKAGQWIKKCVLELGGSDPYIVLKDANIEKAAAICATSRLLNAGQSCIAAKRFIVVKSQQEHFTELFTQHMKAAIMGDPLDAKTTLGPLARLDLREKLHQQVSLSLERGAKCLMGGYIPEGQGAFYPPTILTDVKKGMPAYNEELFGPVASLITVKDNDEAIQVANDTPYGLGAAIFTQNFDLGEKLATHDLVAGNCFINDMVKSDVRLPFGGVKESGFGRELSHVGIKEFVNIKTVFMKEN